jgi:hypothetical protein
VGRGICRSVARERLPIGAPYRLRVLVVRLRILQILSSILRRLANITNNQNDNALTNSLNTCIVKIQIWIVSAYVGKSFRSLIDHH